MHRFWKKLHLDLPLLSALFILGSIGLVILYSASSQDMGTVIRQGIRLGIAFIALLFLAQISPARYRLWAPWFFGIAFFLLVVVFFSGHIGKGAQRWINLGFMRFQPSEFMKLAVPMILAWYFHDKPLPPSAKTLFIAGLLILLPFILVAKQPDLGTALIIAAAGVSVILLTGVKWRFIFGGLALLAAAAPVLWHFLHDYQRERVLTFLDPERDPLGSGYNIIQSKIAIGSGGFYGKGWLNGTQSNLQFLPEHTTDFIFGVCGEEFGLIGGILLVVVFLVIIGRGLYISVHAQDTFSRLLAGSISFIFFISMLVNIGMVSGLLPVVGVPLPLVSYGGTSMVTLVASFGILMSIHTHRKLIGA